MRNEVLLCASMMTNRGGWVLDQQFLIQNGSSVLLAHGMGIPVADASTCITFEVAGSYNVWVRTRDWSKRWSKKGSAGLFHCSY